MPALDPIPPESPLPTFESPKTVLVAIDVNEPPERRDALEAHARRLAREHDARLIACHVVQPPAPVPAIGGLVMAPRATDDLLRRQTAHAKDTLSEELPSADVYAPVGRPAKRIVRLAEALRKPWIVIGDHERSFLSRLFFGSVTDTVVRNAPCPVHVVPLPESWSGVASQRSRRRSVKTRSRRRRRESRAAAGAKRPIQESS